MLYTYNFDLLIPNTWLFVILGGDAGCLYVFPLLPDGPTDSHPWRNQHWKTHRHICASIHTIAVSILYGLAEGMYIIMVTNHHYNNLVLFCSGAQYGMDRPSYKAPTQASPLTPGHDREETVLFLITSWDFINGVLIFHSIILHSRNSQLHVLRTGLYLARAEIC